MGIILVKTGLGLGNVEQGLTNEDLRSGHFDFALRQAQCSAHFYELSDHGSNSSGIPSKISDRCSLFDVLTVPKQIALSITDSALFSSCPTVDAPHSKRRQCFPAKLYGAAHRARSRTYLSGRINVLSIPYQPNGGL